MAESIGVVCLLELVTRTRQSLRHLGFDKHQVSPQATYTGDKCTVRPFEPFFADLGEEVVTCSRRDALKPIPGTRDSEKCTGAVALLPTGIVLRVLASDVGDIGLGDRVEAAMILQFFRLSS
jgi:hypothetical protein